MTKKTKMSKYIEADRLRAMITKYQSTAENAYNPSYEDADYWHGKVVACEDILNIIDWLQKQRPNVDLEKEIDDEIEKMRTAPCYDELVAYALHFFLPRQKQ
ncbi:MAG: hypothetical protein ACSW8H_00075 [bacterium]